MYPPSKHNRKPLLIVSFCLLSGCSALNVHNDDKGDICYTWRSQLRDSEHYYTQSVVEGAVIGGLIGAGTGALGALIGGGNVGTGALIGGGVGAVAGGVGGYYNAKQKDIADEQALAAYNQALTFDDKPTIRSKNQITRIIIQPKDLCTMSLKSRMWQ